MVTTGGKKKINIKIYMTVKSGKEKQQYDVIKGITPAGGEGEMSVLRAEDARRRSEEELD